MKFVLFLAITLFSSHFYNFSEQQKLTGLPIVIGNVNSPSGNLISAAIGCFTFLYNQWKKPASNDQQYWTQNQWLSFLDQNFPDSFINIGSPVEYYQGYQYEMFCTALSKFKIIDTSIDHELVQLKHDCFFPHYNQEELAKLSDNYRQTISKSIDTILENRMWRHKEFFHQQQLEQEQEQLTRKKEQAQRLHEERVQMKKNFAQEIKFVNNSVAEYSELQALYQEYTFGNHLRMQTRLESLKKTQYDTRYYEQSYKVSSNIGKLLSQERINQKEYTFLYGTELQQLVHQECLHVLSLTADLKQDNLAYDYKSALVNTTDSARAYNKHGFTHKALSLVDVCWAMLDYGKVVLEGTVEGVKTAVQGMVDHPVQTAITVVAGKYLLTYHLLKVTTNLTNIGITYLMDEQQGKDAWAEYIKPLTDICDQLYNQELSYRDMLKHGIALTAQLYAEHRMLKGLGSFYDTAKSKALVFAKNNPLTCPATYAKTAEGFAFDLIEEKIGSSNFPPTLHPCTDRCNIFKPLGRGSTGRTTPKNLHEQIAMKSIKANPLMGIELDIKKGMTDPRWHQKDGWIKMAWDSKHIILKDAQAKKSLPNLSALKDKNIEIHYVSQWVNGILKAVDDFKFKDKIPRKK